MTKLAEYIVSMLFLPITGPACLLVGDSDDDWCTLAQQGLIGWGVLLLPALLIGLGVWSADQKRPLPAFGWVVFGVLGLGIVGYLLRGPLLGLFQGGAQVIFIVVFIAAALSFTLWLTNR